MIKILGVIGLGFILLSTVAQAACVKDEVVAADQKWLQVFDANDPQKISELYSKDSVLLATYEQKPIVTESGRQDYFTKLFGKFDHIKVRYKKEFITVFSGGAVSAGLYTFKGTKAGKKTSIPARYIFVYESTPTGCRLIAHHSSVTP